MSNLGKEKRKSMWRRLCDYFQFEDGNKHSNIQPIINDGKVSTSTEEPVVSTSTEEPVVNTATEEPVVKDKLY